MSSFVAQGVLKQHSIGEETTFDTAQAPVAGDAIKLAHESGLILQPDRGYDEVQEAVGTASLQDVRLGARSGKWTAAALLRTAAAGTAPGWRKLAKAAFGVETVNGGTSVVYSLSDDNTNSLVLRQAAGNMYYQEGRGAWCESFDLDYQANQIPKLNFGGGYATHVHVMRPTVGPAGAAISATTVPLTSGHDGGILEGARVTIGGSTNSGNGHLVTDVDIDAGTIEVSPGLTAEVSSGDAIIQVWPSPTYVSDTALAGTKQLLTIDGVTVGVQQAKITLATGVHGLDKTSDRADRLSRADRRLTYDFLAYYLTGSQAAIVGKSWGKSDDTPYPRDIDLRLGVDSAGKRAKFSIPAGICRVTEINLPGSEVAMISIVGTAKQNSAALDEFTLTLD
jgi:hypothetical protein